MTNFHVVLNWVFTFGAIGVMIVGINTLRSDYRTKR